MKDSASVLIIGAGIIGASLAYNLAKKGMNGVVVLDKGGSGSTAASFGGFRHQFSNGLSVQLSIESVKLIENFEQETGYDPIVKHDGYLFVASSEKSFTQLEKNKKLVASLGIPVELLSGEHLQSIFPYYSFAGMLGGTLCMKDGHASTSAVHQGFISKATEMGVSFYGNTEVTKIARSASAVTGVTSSRGEISSKKMVIAAGAYSGLVGGLASVKIPIKPYPRKILVTHSFSDGIPWEVPLIIDVDSTLTIGREGKGVIMADNSPVESGFELAFPTEFDERVISMAVSRVPALSRATLSYANSGLYEMTPDSNPIVSPITDVEGLYCCAGFAGHGFMHAPAIGELMAELIAGERPHLDISSFHIERFKGVTSTEGLII